MIIACRTRLEELTHHALTLTRPGLGGLVGTMRRYEPPFDRQHGRGLVQATGGKLHLWKALHASLHQPAQWTAIPAALRAGLGVMAAGVVAAIDDFSITPVEATRRGAAAAGLGNRSS
jgi:hypothetical protein